MKLQELFTELIEDNTCVNCGNIVDENLRKWFSDKWVNIGKKKKGGGHPPCGTSGKKRGYVQNVYQQVKSSKYDKETESLVYS